MSAAQPIPTRRVSALRTNALAAVVMLLIQYCLGITVSLYATLPISDHGKSEFTGFGAAVGHGPVSLSIHAILGTLLLITAAAAVFRSARVGAAPPIVLTGFALAAIIVAWLTGARFVGHIENGTSLAMALATAVAILCYTLVIVLIGAPPRTVASPNG